MTPETAQVRRDFSRRAVAFPLSRWHSVKCLLATPIHNAKTLRYQFYRDRFRKNLPSRELAVPNASGAAIPTPSTPAFTVRGGIDEIDDAGKGLAPASDIGIKATRMALERVA